MPRPAAKRRAAVVAATTLKQSISNFTRVSKGLASVEGVKAPKQPAQSVSVTVSIATRKRKATLIDEDAENHPPETTTTVSTSTSTAVSKRQRFNEPTPAALAAEAASPPQKTINTELKWRPTTTAKSSSKKLPKDTKKKAQPAAPPQLPPALLELLDMHAAFVKTLMIHLAHNKAAAPIDVRSLAPDVSRAWGKRNLTVDDLRRCLAVQGLGHAEAPFFLADYGRGKICVEMSPAFGGRVDEHQLCNDFKHNLSALCRRASQVVHAVDACMDGLSLSDLPQAPIASMKMAAAANPLLAKGHRALVELKSGLAAKQKHLQQQQAAAARENIPAESAPKLGLLDRLRLKQLAKARELPLSGPEFERRVALQRVEDIAAVISTLSLQTPLSLPRQAYAMSNLVQRVRDSLRLPISGEEAARCIKMLADEVAPGWIRVVTIGARENVVVQRSGQPIDRVIQERVRELLA